jgi:hypothetical protein
MLGWLRWILDRRSRRSTPSWANIAGVQSSDVIGKRSLVLDDAKQIEAALIALARIGLRLNAAAKDSLHATAEKIAAQWEGICFTEEPTLEDWALLALSGEFGPFENAIFVQDHCFDGISLEDYRRMVTDIISLSGDVWPVENVSVEVKPNSALGWKVPVTVTIKAKPDVAPFELVHDKDFDWTIICRLNERLPKGVLGHFAIFYDGNAYIVFLTPEEIRKLNSICGHDFDYAKNPEVYKYN